MRTLHRLRSWWRAFLHRQAMEGGMSDELEFHIERHAEHLASTQGLSRDEALRRAHVDFGSVERYKEEARRSLGLALVDNLRCDVRYAWRTATKHKGFTATVIAILAVTIGANAAVYTLVDRLLVRPLPYPEPDRLGTIVRHFDVADRTASGTNVTGSVWERCATACRISTSPSSAEPAACNLTAGEDIAYVQQQRVSAGFFRVLGIAACARPRIHRRRRSPGRTVRRRAQSFALVARASHADPTIVGRAITLRGEPFVVVGVLADGFRPSIPCGSLDAAAAVDARRRRR